jgi:cation:H+ antiporter
MVLAPAIPVAAAAMAIADRFVGRVEGALLVGIYAGYVALILREGRLMRARSNELEAEAAQRPRSRVLLVGMTLGGLLLLSAGAAAAVAGATRLIGEAGLSEGFVGAAVLGVIVSLDEILLEVLPARRGDPGLATGNLMGTLAAFCSGVLGIAALIRPLDIDSTAALAFLGSAFLYTVVATAFLARRRASWGLGLFVLAFYGFWLLVAAEV